MTVHFADLVGFTGRAERSDPEAVRDLQRAYFAADSAEVDRYVGTVEKFIGDAVMAIFGTARPPMSVSRWMRTCSSLVAYADLAIAAAIHSSRRTI